MQAAQKNSSMAAEGGSAGGEIDRSVQLSCGEHTDYGLLTLVNQDPDIPALQVPPPYTQSIPFWACLCH